jgi:hypothetical protein
MSSYLLDTTLVVGGTPDRFAAVKGGGVSAAMVTPPTSFMALEAGLNVLANIGNYLPDYQLGLRALEWVN